MARTRSLALSVAAGALVASTALAASPNVRADLPPLPETIPATLQSQTACMVEMARAAPNVSAATRGVETDDDSEFVFVRFWYRTSEGFRWVATYSQVAHPPPGKLAAFTTLLPGVFPACDVRHGKRDCSNLRRWEAEEHARGPVDGWGADEVLAAWNKTCGVVTIAITA